jgi:hypothetical protein
MFLDDEIEYIRLKRSDSIMGWLAISFVAALVFMFAGLVNSASATGSSQPHGRVLRLQQDFILSQQQPLRDGSRTGSMVTQRATAADSTSPLIKLTFAW